MGVNENIFLIGFMGSGKSTIGRMLAKALNSLFLDTDDWIEEHTQKSIPEIFSSQGEEYFRLLEKKALEHLATGTGQIIATGGGMPCFYDNIKTMNQYGITIYLRMEPKDLLQRLRNETAKRPLLHNKSEEELLGWMDLKIKERNLYYEQATFIIDAHQEKEWILEELLRKLHPYV